MGHNDYETTSIYADYAPDPAQGARYAAQAFAEDTAGAVSRFDTDGDRPPGPDGASGPPR